MNHLSRNRILLIAPDRQTAADFRALLLPPAGSPAQGPAPAASPAADDFEIDTVDGAEQAWQAVRQASEQFRPYAVVALCLAPTAGADGIQTVQRLRDLDPTLLFLVCAEPVEETCARAAAELGGLDRVLVLPPPLSRSGLRQAVNWLLQHLRVCAELHDATLQLESAEQTIRRLYAEAEAGGRFYYAVMQKLRCGLRSSLHAILGFSARLMKEPLGTANARRLRYVREGGMSLLRLIDETLDFMMVIGGRLIRHATTFSVEEVVQEVLELTAAAARAKDLSVRYQHDARIPAQVRGDRDWLRKVLLHLVENAVQFTPHGRICVGSTLAAETEETVTLRLTVTDTGVGISYEQQNSLFDISLASRRIEPTASGRLGLGLALCQNLVRALDGSIGVESAPGQGSEFWFTAALEKPPALPAGAADRRESSELELRGIGDERR